MNEIPWQNITLALLAMAVREHPEWAHIRDWSTIAQDAEQHALDRGADSVDQDDLRAAIAAYEAETLVSVAE